MKIPAFPRIFRVFVPILAMFIAATAAVAGTHPGEAAFAREMAQKYGLSERHVLDILDGAVRQQSILDAISKPAESKPWKDYRPIFLTRARIDGGVAFYTGNRDLLQSVADEYGVDPEYIVAIIGVETSYGTNIGKYRVIDALTTLAFYYPPREKFFRGELEKLLTMPEHQLPMPIGELKGSYAGAMGWGQFMPSSIAAYARDADGDGRIDLMGSLPDIVASVANYLARHGWVMDAPVAVPAQRMADAQPVETERSKPVHTVESLEARGYAATTRVSAATPATLLELAGAEGTEYWLTFGNFEVITRYNRSPLYAMAVTQLAAAIRDGVAASGITEVAGAPAPATASSVQ